MAEAPELGLPEAPDAGASFPAPEAARPQLRLCDPAGAADLGRTLGIGPTVAQVLVHRGLADVPRAREFLDARLVGLTAPDAMRGRSEAAERIASAIRRRERVAVFGDYDVDGTTSATIVCGVIEALGGDAVALEIGRAHV